MSLPGGFHPIGANQYADIEIPAPGWPEVLGDGQLHDHLRPCEWQAL